MSRRRVACALAVAIACGGVPAFAQDGAGAEAKAERPVDVFTPSLRKHLERQDRLAEEGDLETLVDEAEERIADPTPDNYYLLGRAYGNTALRKRQEKEIEEFRELLGRARRAFGKAKELGGLLYAPAHLGLARCELFEQDLDGADEELKKALEIEPTFREAVILRAQLLWERNLESDAEFELYTYLQKRPEDDRARTLLGMFKIKRKRWAEAESEFARVLDHLPDDLAARKGLGTALMFQRHYEEAAGHLELVRGADPTQDDVYMTLFHVYRQMRDAEKAMKVLEAALRHLPNTEVARRAAERLKEIQEDPEAWAAPDMSVEELVSGLDSPDEQVVLKTLYTMQTMKWALLPQAVYRLLKNDVAGPAVRRQAMRLIGEFREPRTLTILEIKLDHPTDRDPDPGVREETLSAIAKLPTHASLFILWEALHGDDVAAREIAVKGIAVRTGKWFRTELEKPTPANLWPDELARYDAWWATGSASLAKRKAVRELADLYAHVRDRDRVSGALLHALDDRNPKTWRVAYDVFRAWTFTSFMEEDDARDVPLATRERVAADARAWYDERMSRDAGKDD